MAYKLDTNQIDISTHNFWPILFTNEFVRREASLYYLFDG